MEIPIILIKVQRAPTKTRRISRTRVAISRKSERPVMKLILILVKKTQGIRVREGSTGKGARKYIPR